MKKILCALVFLSGVAVADVAAAHGNVQCDVPREQRKPMIELQRQLKRQGWTVRKVQAYNGCYEVYGYDDKDKPVEAFFHPATFERVEEQLGVGDSAPAQPQPPVAKN